ncbi:MAG: dockerin type I domain-containing protein [Ruminococcus sp.]|nr:dockerin type I domain-containing protein [Ruminococcus sp.]
MKKTTKFISLLLAVLMVCSCFAGLTVMTAGAADETPEQKIYFKYPTNGAWGDPAGVKVNSRNKSASVYCHVYAIYGNENDLNVYAFMANATACKSEGNNVYSFDLAKYSATPGVAAIEDNADYGIIVSAKSGSSTYQTTDIMLNKDCIGDSIVVTEMTPTRENSSDSSKKDFCAAWENTPSCGMRASITSLNNVLEGTFPASMPKAKPLSDQLKKYLTNATNLPFYQWEKTPLAITKGAGCNKDTCAILGVTGREVYDQYLADNAEAIATGVVHPADDTSPVDYIEYQGYNDAGNLTTLKMAAPSAVAAVLNLEYPVVDPTTEPEPTTVEPTTVEPTTVEPTTVEPTTVEPTTVEPTTVEPPTEPAPETVYSVAGDPFNSWDATDVSTELTKGDDGLYTYTTAMEPVQNAQFKIVTNHSWEEAYGDNGNNFVFNVDTACDVTITFNADTKEITVSGDGVSMPADLEIEAIRAVGNGEGNWLNGVAWEPANDANLMSEVSDGIYEITFNNVSASFAYQIKFAANGEWVANWGGVEDNVTVSGTTYDSVWDGNNINVEVEEDGATVKAQLDLREFDFKQKTGAKYTITIEYPEQEGVILGDVDNDGQVTIDDATMLQQALVKMIELDEIAQMVGDVNGDGKLSIMDVTFIQRYLAGNTADAYGYANKTGTFIPSN